MAGFAIDLALELSRLLRCNFTIKVVDDNRPGSKYGEELLPGVWSGMLGEVNTLISHSGFTLQSFYWRARFPQFVQYQFDGKGDGWNGGPLHRRHVHHYLSQVI